MQIRVDPSWQNDQRAQLVSPSLAEFDDVFCDDDQ